MAAPPPRAAPLLLASPSTDRAGPTSPPARCRPNASSTTGGKYRRGSGGGQEGVRRGSGGGRTRVRVELTGVSRGQVVDLEQRRGSEGGPEGKYRSSVDARCRCGSGAKEGFRRGSGGEVSVECSEPREPQNPTKNEEYQRRLQGVLYRT
eukprot:500500-Prorocentrum_minimum.AAC.2